MALRREHPWIGSGLLIRYVRLEIAGGVAQQAKRCVRRDVHSWRVRKRCHQSFIAQQKTRLPEEFDYSTREHRMFDPDARSMPLHRANIRAIHPLAELT